MIRRAVLAGLLLGAAAPPPGASSCSGCHGGVAPLPALAGRDAAALASALGEFRSGQRPATVMGRISKGFSPEESIAIATWWAEQK
jgi:sulfide dehydrogenase cytochrome subunit